MTYRATIAPIGGFSAIIRRQADGALASDAIRDAACGVLYSLQRFLGQHPEFTQAHIEALAFDVRLYHGLKELRNEVLLYEDVRKLSTGYRRMSTLPGPEWLPRSLRRFMEKFR